MKTMKLYHKIDRGKSPFRWILSTGFCLTVGIFTLFIGCSDEREAPVTPGIPTYSETKTLANEVSIAGDTLSLSFTLRDTVENARLYITGYIKPDNTLNYLYQIEAEIDSINTKILGLSAQIIGLDTISLRTPEQQRQLDSLRQVKMNEEAVKSYKIALADSLDTRLDDRFKVAIGLDTAPKYFYPRAIYLDSNTLPPDTNLVSRYLNPGEVAIWGQGFYLPKPDTSGWIGKTMQLNLGRFWIADETYRARSKPARPSNPDTLPELFPITDWLNRLTPNTTHTLHITFAAPATTAKITVSLYLVYKTTG